MPGTIFVRYSENDRPTERHDNVPDSVIAKVQRAFKKAKEHDLEIEEIAVKLGGKTRVAPPAAAEVGMSNLVGDED